MRQLNPKPTPYSSSTAVPNNMKNNSSGGWRNGTTVGWLIIIIPLFIIILFQLYVLDKKSNELQSTLEKMTFALQKIKEENKENVNHFSHALNSKSLNNDVSTVDGSGTTRKLQSMYELVHSMPPEDRTDKVVHHRYDRFYDYFLEPLRSTKINMLEIGYNLGHSYQMWLKYFPKGMVYFMEKDDGRKFPEARFTGDQGSVEDLERLLKTKKMKGKLDFIIDDGSHVPIHQITSFKYLWKNGLKPGGIYIVEDTEMNYWTHGDSYGHPIKGGKNHPDSIITMFKDLVDVVNREYAPKSAPFTSIFGDDVDSWVGSIYFGLNCVILIKMTEEERRDFLHRTYRFGDKLAPLPVK